MPAGIKISYDDDWCIRHWSSFRNWKKLCDEYNRTHDTDISYNTFKSHCNRELGINYHYSKEQERWLIENYPHLGIKKCTKEFNRIFNDSRSNGAIKIRCLQLGVKTTEERRKERAIENTGRYHAVGAIIKKTHGEPYIKCEDGKWRRLKDIVYGYKPKGYLIVHLDGDVNNYEKDNLLAIPRSISARMTANNFWSDFSEVTKTGIICCELEEAIDRSEI